MASKLKLVRQPEKPPVSIDAMWRAEAKTRDWGAVHVACDRSEPVQISRRFGRWSWPVSRKGGA